MDVLADTKIQGGQGIGSRNLLEYFLILVLTVCLGGAIFLSVWKGLAFISLGYEVRALEREEGELINLSRELEVEKGMLTSPERIEKIARKQLGMINPGPDQIRVIR
jgi:cell division protein FtsL